jgi:DNA-binding MarR family transcriptional regulator
LAVNPTSKPARADQIDAAIRELIELVRPVFSALKRGGPMPPEFERAFTASALGPRHVPVLLAVTAAGELSVTELAEQIGLSLSTTSLMVGELSRAGLLQRAEDENDRRRTIVRLTASYREPVSA